MSTIVFSLMAIIFPLNSFLAFPGSWASGKENVDELVIVEQVKGVETEKEQKISLGNILPVAQYQPIMKADARDLVLPDAHASLILDVESGTILHYENGKQKRQIASLTKMMTAVLVMEKVKDLDEEVVISAGTINTIGTVVGCPNTGVCISQRLVAGEKISVRSLLRAMLMNSTNDAARALAEHVGGSEKEFVVMMNAKAKEMGLNDTNFCTASGLEPDGREQECYSTAYDIARIAAYALNFPEIWETFKFPSNLEIDSIDGKYTHTILNTNRLIGEMPGILGGKTGFTPLAGHSLLMAVEDESGVHKIIAVLLDDPYRWQDIKLMTSWAFNSYDWK